MKKRELVARPIYTLDIETDPFHINRYPMPFCIGFYDGAEFTKFWGSDCVERMHAWLSQKVQGIIYAHNGGRFDVFYLMKWIIGNPMRIIKSRIIKAMILCKDGFHELRDSYAIMPFPLGKFKGKVQKKEIDITKLEKEVREQHKDEIIEYLKYDCISLWELCVAFVEMFGLQLTIGTTAMKELRKIHTFQLLDAEMDSDFRGKFYFGGRVECFQKGILPGAWKVYDVNSMYPSVMRNMKHPIGQPSWEGVKVGKTTCFITVTGKNYGAFPLRIKSGTDFSCEYGTFHVTRHEWDTAMEFGLFEPEKIHRCINFEDQGTFEEFVDRFYNARLKAKLDGDAITELFYKFILNSAYGKFGQNPENYEENIITDQTTSLYDAGWKPSKVVDISKLPEDNYIVWSKPTNDTSRFNVATGSSITGASRAVLLRGINNSINPIYCDTDSIICEALPDSELDSNKLGAWKLEAESDLACIAGKKLYALFQGSEVVKQANKGVNVTAQEIRRVCEGEIITSRRDAPSFKLDGSHRWINRKVRMT